MTGPEVPTGLLRGAHSAVESPPDDLDEESAAWLRALRSSGPAYEEAIRRLHDLLLAAARREVYRRRSSVPAGDHADLAQQSANDATVAVLASLSSFRGASRFTTWAYKFAVLQAAVAVRRLAWRDREVSSDPLTWDLPADVSTNSPSALAEARGVADALRDAVDDVLTAHQREVLLAIAVHGVPIDVLAERLATSRGALYKTLHDARARLRRRLAQQGFPVPGRRTR